MRKIHPKIKREEVKQWLEQTRTWVTHALTSCCARHGHCAIQPRLRLHCQNQTTPPESGAGVLIRLATCKNSKQKATKNMQITVISMHSSVARVYYTHRHTEPHATRTGSSLHTNLSGRRRRTYALMTSSLSVRQDESEWAM